MIVRGDEAIPPRGVTRLRAGDRIHVLMRREARRGSVPGADRRAGARARSARRPRAAARARRAASRSSPRARGRRPTATRPRPPRIAGQSLLEQLRIRRDRPGGLFVLDDGRYALAGPVLAVGGRTPDVRMGPPPHVPREPGRARLAPDRRSAPVATEVPECCDPGSASARLSSSRAAQPRSARRRASRIGANAAATSSASCSSRPDTISAPRAARPCCCRQLQQQRAHEVGRDHLGRRRRLAPQVEALHGVQRHAVVARVRDRRLHGGALGVVGATPARSRASPPRSPARPTRSRGRRTSPRGSRLEQQLQAQPRGRVRARPERLPRVDHDLVHARPHGLLLPRRPDPEPPADQDRHVEALPALGPVVRAPARRAPTTRAPPTSASPSGSDGSSPGAPYSAYSTQPSPSTCSSPDGAISISAARTCSAVVGGSAERQPDQRNARRTREKSEPSSSRSAQVVLGEGPAEALEHLALLAARGARGRPRSTTTRWSPRRPRPERRHALAAQRHDRARLGAGLDLDLLVPSSVGDLTRRAERGVGRRHVEAR